MNKTRYNAKFVLLLSVETSLIIYTNLKTLHMLLLLSLNESPNNTFYMDFDATTYMTDDACKISNP